MEEREQQNIQAEAKRKREEFDNMEPIELDGESSDSEQGPINIKD